MAEKQTGIKRRKQERIENGLNEEKGEKGEKS